MFEFVVCFIAFMFWHGLGVTVGYHRLISHRTFRCPRFIEYFFVLGGLMAFEGSPIWWATIHRAHHRYVDTEKDPHSPRFGIKHAWYGWTGAAGYADGIEPAKLCPDLCGDSIYAWLDRGGSWKRARDLTLALPIAFRLVLLALFGWKVALASLLAGLFVLQIPLMLNVCCHLPKLGYRTYARTDDSVNVWWIGLLAFGEGWHNNHHAFPGSARTGMKWFELDVSWIVIQALEKVGLASHVQDAKKRISQSTRCAQAAA